MAPNSSRTRHDLHRLSVHVLARRRSQVSTRFGLRAAPGGIATPAFGPEPEVLRVSATALVRELGSASARHPLAGASLRDLADFCDADLAPPFSAGDETPAIGDADAPLELDPDELGLLYDWFDLGARVLDFVLSRPEAGSVSTVQLWPEHFDLATSVTLPTGAGVNLGFSPGDDFHGEPYAYVGPWNEERPGPAGYWNAPFGAMLARPPAVVSGDADAECAAFIRRGLGLLVGG